MPAPNDGVVANCRAIILAPIKQRTTPAHVIVKRLPAGAIVERTNATAA